MKKIKQISIHIPLDILEQTVLPKLPLKSIVRFRCVSKHWNTILSTTSSVFKKHFQLIQESNNEINLKAMVCNGSNLYSLECETYGGNIKVVEMNHTFVVDENATRIVGSYDGFICISQDNVADLYVWNPSTHECKLLPRFMFTDEEWEYNTNGFGYNEIDREFQVVNIWSTDQPNTPSYVQLYSSKKNKWEEMTPIDYRVLENGGRLLNGVLYWLAQHIARSGVYNDVVIAYNINRREFKEVRLLNTLNNKSDRWSGFITGIGVLHGCLCVFLSNRFDLNHLEAWIMEDYGIEKSWARLFQISCSPCTSWVRMVPLCFMNDCTELLISDESGFYVYDFKDQYEPLKIYVIKNLPEGTYESIAYKDSMVKLCELDGSGG